jgi:hypothetical protein
MVTIILPTDSCFVQSPEDPSVKKHCARTRRKRRKRELGWGGKGPVMGKKRAEARGGLEKGKG